MKFFDRLFIFFILFFEIDDIIYEFIVIFFSSEKPPSYCCSTSISVQYNFPLTDTLVSFNPSEETDHSVIISFRNFVGHLGKLCCLYTGGVPFSSSIDVLFSGVNIL